MLKVMNIKNTKGRITLVSMLIVALFVMMGGIYMFKQSTKAAAIQSAKDVLTDARPGQASNHTLTFTINNAIDAGDTLTIDFDDGTFDFVTTGFAITDAKDYDIDDDGADKVVVVYGACAADQFEIDSMTNSVFQFTYCAGSTAVASGSIMTVQIGTNASTSGGTGDTQITNPAESAGGGVADTPTITVGGTFGGSGDLLVALVAGVTVSVTVDESAAFTIAGRSDAQCADYDNTAGTEIALTSATAVTFPTITSSNDETFIDGCQRLTVSTNAATGYVITVAEDDQLESVSSTILDGTCDSGCGDSTEAQWATSTNNGFGYCMVDIAGGGDAAATADAGWGTNDCDDADTYFKTIASIADSDTVANIMSSVTAVSGDVSDIGYRLSVSDTQAAGAYQNIVSFVMTPTY